MTDINELRSQVKGLQEKLEQHRGERERVTQQLAEIDTRLADPDELRTPGQLLADKEKFVKGLDRLTGQIAASEARLEILTERVAAADMAAQVAALEATVAQARLNVASHMERIAQKAAELKAEIEQLYEAGLPGNLAAANIHLVTKGEKHVRPVLILALLQGFKHYMLPKLHQITEPGIVLHDADYVLYGEPMLPPWRKLAEPAAVEPEQAEDQPIAS